MAIDLNRTRHYFEEAYENYGKIRGVYNEVLEFTDPFATVDSTPGEDSRIESRRSTLVAITEPLATLNSFIMKSMLTRGSRFASLEYEVEKNNSDAQEGEPNETEVSSEALEELEANTRTVFDYIESSNYYTVIARAMTDAEALGTGCFRVLEQNSTTKPFTFKYQPINNLYVTEDAFGKPNYVFNALGEVTVERLMDLYPGIKIPSVQGEEWEASVDVVECVVPEYDENKGETIYNYAILNAAMDTILYEEEKEMNPIVVFRFDKTSQSPYGIGLGVKLLSTYQKLLKYDKLRERHAELIVDPPGGYIGDPSLFMKLSMKKGARNYLGSGMAGDTVDFKTLYPVGDIVAITEDIQTLKEEILDVCMGAPLGDIDTTRNRTADELSMRLQVFRDKFSGVYESLQEELLQSTFLIPLSILMKKDILSFPVFSKAIGTKEGATVSDLVEFSNFKYINNASDAGNKERSAALKQYVGEMKGIVSPDMAPYIVKEAGFIAETAKLESVPALMSYTKKELTDIQDQIDQQRQSQVSQGVVGDTSMDDQASMMDSQTAAAQAQAPEEAM